MDDKDKKEKKQIVITGMTVAKFVSALAGIAGIVLIVTNLIGATDMDWLSIGLMFVAPLLIFIATMKKQDVG